MTKDSIIGYRIGYHIAIWDGRHWLPWCEFDKLAKKPDEICQKCLALAINEAESDE